MRKKSEARKKERKVKITILSIISFQACSHEYKRLIKHFVLNISRSIARFG